MQLHLETRQIKHTHQPNYPTETQTEEDILFRHRLRVFLAFIPHAAVLIIKQGKIFLSSVLFLWAILIKHPTYFSQCDLLHGG